jgi:cytochrome c oxidase subunit 3/cytochrome o ubiquinol oxidase subunit 3
MCLLLSEAAFFAVFVVAYLFYIGASMTGPTPADVLDLGPTLVNTACLVSSSLTIVLAVRALRRGATGRFTAWWTATALLGAEFLFGTAREWSRLIGRDGLTPSTNLFGTTFYSLVGAHAAHVTAGLLAIVLVLVLALGGRVSSAHGERLELLSWYWHFVDAVWVVVFTSVYVAGR